MAAEFNYDGNGRDEYGRDGNGRYEDGYGPRRRVSLSDSDSEWPDMDDIDEIVEKEVKPSQEEIEEK